MIYPETFETKIGFDSIRAHIAELCQSPLGVAECEAMTFSSDYEAVTARLRETAEMQGILVGDEAFPAENIHDMTAAVGSARVEGSFIAPGDLLRLRTSMATMTAIVKFFAARRDDDGATPYPALDAVAAGLQSFPVLTAAIDKVIDRWGAVKDNASPVLAEIRGKISSMGGTVSMLMRRIISRAVKDGLVDADVTPSVRDGRLVIPVSPMNKRRIPGIVHDESASGKTVFIEPSEVVEVNNRIRGLQLEERREETRILIALTDQIRPYADELLASYAVLGYFDFIVAKARYAISAGAAMPSVEPRQILEWRQGRHPVLEESLRRQDKQVVPLDIALDADHRLLIVSGPNAGGKSVTLKTVAVLQYMMQCGVLPTLESTSAMGIFDSVFIDIGDDQSIEDDLSTYSSHLRNMKFFYQRGNSRTLILIDEFGAGTEPQIGGAIAQALLKQFNAKGMWGVITTHFRNLKQFADDTPGLVNGSMLYDRHLMKPLFRLSIGNPGSSFAVEIARKTGLPEEIISDAEEIVGSDYINSDKYLLDINRDKRYWENKRMAIRQKEKKLEQLIERYETDAESLRANRREIIAEAKEEARRIIDGSNAAIERTIHEIKKAQAEKEKTREARQQLVDSRRSLDDNDHEASLRSIASRRKKKKTQTQAAVVAHDNPKEIVAGTNVTLDGGNTVGTVESVSGKEATVIFGNLKTKVKLSRLSVTLRKADSGATKSASFVSASTTDAERQRQLNFKQEIDLRGQRVDEALQSVTYYIDDAIRFGSQRVRILHGTGTGALRQYIRDYLATVPGVRGFHDEDVRLGGAGITVVEL